MPPSPPPLPLCIWIPTHTLTYTRLWDMYQCNNLTFCLPSLHFLSLSSAHEQSRSTQNNTLTENSKKKKTKKKNTYKLKDAHNSALIHWHSNRLSCHLAQSSSSTCKCSVIEQNEKRFEKVSDKMNLNGWVIEMVRFSGIYVVTCQLLRWA